MLPCDELFKIVINYTPSTKLSKLSLPFSCVTLHRLHSQLTSLDGERLTLPIDNGLFSLPQRSLANSTIPTPFAFLFKFRFALVNFIHHSSRKHFSIIWYSENSLLFSLPFKSLYELQTVQNSALCFSNSTGFKLNPCIHFKIHPHLSDLLHIVTSSRSLSSSSIHPIVPSASLSIMGSSCSAFFFCFYLCEVSLGGLKGIYKK